MPEDHRHIAVINHVWELPFGPGRAHMTHGPLAMAIGGWNINGIWSLATGEHFTPGLAAAVSSSAGGGGDRPNRIADGNLSGGQRTIDRWFDSGAFATPAQYNFGNAGRGILVGPGNFNVDAGIHRQFTIREHYRLTFRWERFNAFNRANFCSASKFDGRPIPGFVQAT